MPDFTGKRPVGWLGPGLTETYETPDHLTAAGIKHIGDWVYDDEPTAEDHGDRHTRPYVARSPKIRTRLARSLRAKAREQPHGILALDCPQVAGRKVEVVYGCGHLRC